MSRKRTHEVSRLADQAWDNLTSTVHSGGDRAKAYSSKVTSGSKEAKRRADAALDALAGKKSPTRWGWIAGAAALGVAIGWVVTVFGRQAVTKAQEQLSTAPEELQLYADEVTPAH